MSPEGCAVSSGRMAHDSSWLVWRFYFVDLKSHVFEKQEILLWTDMDMIFFV